MDLFLSFFGKLPNYFMFIRRAPKRINLASKKVQTPSLRIWWFWMAVMFSILYIFSVSGSGESGIYWLANIVNGVTYPFYLAFSFLIGFAAIESTEELLVVSSANIGIVTYYYAGLRIFLVDATDDNSKQTWADSVYYLGFILTLVSLIVALTKIRDFSAAEAIKGIIVQNAIALSSTVIALILRTAWRLSIVEPKSELEYVQRLSQAYQDLEKNVSVNNVAFENLSGTVQKSNDKLVQSILNLGARMDQFEIDPKIIADAFSKAANLAFEQMSAKLKTLDQTFVDASTSIQNSVKQFVDNAAELDAKAVFEKQLEGAFSAIREATEKESTQLLVSLRGSVDEFSLSLNGSAASLENSIHNLQQHAQNLDLSGIFSEQVRASLSGFSESLEQETDGAFSAISERTELLVREIEDSSEKIRSSIDSFSNGLSEFNVEGFMTTSTSSSVTQLNEEIASELDSLKEHFSQLQVIFTSVSDAHRQSQSSLKATTNEFETATQTAKSLNSAVSETSDSLQKIVKQIERNKSFFENTKEMQKELSELRLVLKDFSNAVTGGFWSRFSNVFGGKS